MIKRMASGLVMAVLIAVLCVPVMGQFPSDHYLLISKPIDFTALEDHYVAAPLPDYFTEGEPPCADDYSVWYTFTLTETTQIGIYTEGFTEGSGTMWLPNPDPDSQVEVQAGLYRDDGGLVELRCGTGGSALSVHFIETLSAGTYFIQVGTAVPPHSYRLVVAPSPSNDEMSNALAVTLPLNYSFRFTSVTSSGDGAYTCADQHSVWFTFTLDRQKLVNIFAHAWGFPWPVSASPRVGLYRSGDPLSLIKCTGDDTAEIKLLTDYGRSYGFTRRLEAGTYHLQLGTRGTMLTGFDVYIHEQPVNDDLSDAKLLTFPFGYIIDGQYAGGRPFYLLSGATMQTGIEPTAHAACPATLRYSVWYKFKLDTRQVITLAQAQPLGLVKPSNTLIDKPLYMDLWRKSSGLQAAGCSSTGVLVKTLDAGTYYLRIASPIKLHRQAPAYYYLAGITEPVGMPTIIDQPDDIVVRPGQKVALSVVAASPTPLSYQWYSGYRRDTSIPIDGATGAIFTIPANPDGTPSIYAYKPLWVRVSNAVGYRDSESARIDYIASIVYTELLDNGNFENGGSGWTLKNGSGDKVSCNSDGYTSPCAFVFTGGAGENALISQTQTLPSESFWGGLVLKLRAKTKSTNQPFVVRVKITYHDGRPPMVKKLTYPSLSEYAQLSDNVLQFVSHNAVKNVTVMIKHKSTTGKTLIDDVKLLLGRNQTTGRGDVLPPPDAPDGFRGTN